MAPIKIRARGASTEQAEKPAKPKRGAKAKPAKRASTRAKAKPAKRGPGRPRKEEGAPVRRNSTGVDPKLEARLLKAVQAAGDRRREAKIEHEESVNALYEVAKEALAAGVSMAKVSDASDLSRQWLYKMGEHAGRENGGSAAAPKRAARKPAKPAAASTGTRRQRSTTRTASKPQRRSRVSVRSS